MLTRGRAVLSVCGSRMAKNNVLQTCEFSCSSHNFPDSPSAAGWPQAPRPLWCSSGAEGGEGWRGQGSGGVRKDPGLPVGVFQVLIEDTDQLWHNHCLRDFKNEKPEEFETWREMYLRLHDAREQRLLMLARNIGSAHANKPKGGVGLEGLGNSRVPGNAAGGSFVGKVSQGGCFESSPSQELLNSCSTCGGPCLMA